MNDASDDRSGFAARTKKFRTLTALRSGLPPEQIQKVAHEALSRLAKSGTAGWRAPRNEVLSLCRALCAPHPHASAAIIDRLMAADVPYHRIYEGYLAEAARELGTWWDRDQASFAEVTAACARIYTIIERLRRAAVVPRRVSGGRLAFAGVPGEQHTLGLRMASDMFSREGWDVLVLEGMDHDALVDACNDVDIVLLGLTASGGQVKQNLLRLLVVLRVVRPDLRIMISGQITKAEPTFLNRLGADCVVETIEEALQETERLMRAHNLGP